MRGGADPIPMALDWVWESDVYCRTGSVGDTLLDRKCQSVERVPGVGVKLDYTTSDDPDEYWVFQ